MKNPFRYFDSSAEVIRLVVMIYVRFPLPLWNVDAQLAEYGIAISSAGKTTRTDAQPHWLSGKPSRPKTRTALP